MTAVEGGYFFPLTSRDVIYGRSLSRDKIKISFHYLDSSTVCQLLADRPYTAIKRDLLTLHLIPVLSLLYDYVGLPARAVRSSGILLCLCSSIVSESFYSVAVSSI